MKVRVDHKRRLEKIRQYLSENKLKALATFETYNVLYTSGFIMDTAFVERPFAAVIPAEGAPYMILCELSTYSSKFAIEQGLCWIDDIVFYSEHPRVSKRVHTVKEWNRLFHEALAQRGLKGSIGVDRMSLATSVATQTGGLQFVDCSEFIRDMRKIKSEEELDILRKCAQASDVGNERLAEVLADGKYHHEIESEVWEAVWKELVKYGTDNYVGLNEYIMGSGPYVVAPHSAPGNAGRKLQKGDVVITGVFPRINGYSSENERTWFIGEPTQHQVKAFNVMKKATEACIEAAVVGNRWADIDAAAQRVYEDAGYAEYILHRTGHGKGLEGHEYPFDMAFNMEPLKPGMVSSAEPGIYMPGTGAFRFADNIIITTGKAEHVTSLKYKDLDRVTIRRK